MTPPRIEAGWREAADGARLLSPSVGWFQPALEVGNVVYAGAVLGRLDVLGAERLVIAPAAARGAVTSRAGAGLARFAVDHGGVLYELDLDAAAVVRASEASTATTGTAAGLVFVSPMSGRFYGRPGPGKPPFVSAGDEIAEGHTICLLEVMKTFNRITYGGPGLPPRARVLEVVAADEADVDAGAVLVRLEPT